MAASGTLGSLFGSVSLWRAVVFVPFLVRISPLFEKMRPSSLVRLLHSLASAAHGLAENSWVAITLPDGGYGVHEREFVSVNSGGAHLSRPRSRLGRGTTVLARGHPTNTGLEEERIPHRWGRSTWASQLRKTASGASAWGTPCGAPHGWWGHVRRHIEFPPTRLRAGEAKVVPSCLQALHSESGSIFTHPRKKCRHRDDNAFDS